MAYKSKPYYISNFISTKQQPKINKLILVIVGLFFLLPISGKAQKSNTKKPNIIFMMSDNHAYKAIDAYDNRLLQTPNIDRLAKEGMLFANASVTNSI